VLRLPVVGTMGDEIEKATRTGCEMVRLLNCSEKNFFQDLKYR
jgi:hypothetical protein